MTEAGGAGGGQRCRVAEWWSIDTRERGDQSKKGEKGGRSLAERDRGRAGTEREERM
jgi:hypothetical protein